MILIIPSAHFNRRSCSIYAYRIFLSPYRGLKCNMHGIQRSVIMSSDGAYLEIEID
jgi:hypothetical protein